MRRRLAEMERLAPGRGSVGAEFWNARGRARRYDAVVAGSAERDPLLARLRRTTTRTSTVIDVGAGTGRFSLALAPRVNEVVAVDPSRAMLGVLRREARRRGIDNVRSIESTWQDLGTKGAPAAPPPADVVLCSYVLPLIEDAAGFLTKMDASCRGRGFVYMNAVSADALSDPFWRHFHGRPRRPAPTYLDAVAVLRELGLRPEVEIVEVQTMSRYKTVAEAVRAYRDTLVLPDTAEVRAELRSLLRSWLVEDGEVLRPPMRMLPAAIVSWPGSAVG